MPAVGPPVIGDDACICEIMLWFGPVCAFRTAFSRRLMTWILIPAMNAVFRAFPCLLKPNGLPKSSRQPLANPWVANVLSFEREKKWTAYVNVRIMAAEISHANRYQA